MSDLCRQCGQSKDGLFRKQFFRQSGHKKMSGFSQQRHSTGKNRFTKPALKLLAAAFN